MTSVRLFSARLLSRRFVTLSFRRLDSGRRFNLDSFALLISRDWTCRATWCVAATVAVTV